MTSIWSSMWLVKVAQHISYRLLVQQIQKSGSWRWELLSNSTLKRTRQLCWSLWTTTIKILPLKSIENVGSLTTRLFHVRLMSRNLTVWRNWKKVVGMSKIQVRLLLEVDLTNYLSIAEVNYTVSNADITLDSTHTTSKSSDLWQLFGIMFRCYYLQASPSHPKCIQMIPTHTQSSLFPKERRRLLFRLAMVSWRLKLSLWEIKKLKNNILLKEMLNKLFLNHLKLRWRIKLLKYIAKGHKMPCTASCLWTQIAQLLSKTVWAWLWPNQLELQHFLTMNVTRTQH